MELNVETIEDIFPFPQQHDISRDFFYAQQLNLLWNDGTVLTFSADGLSYATSNLNRSNPLLVHCRYTLWCHTVFATDTHIVDLWHPDLIVPRAKYTAELQQHNPDLTIKIYDELQEVTYDL